MKTVLSLLAAVAVGFCSARAQAQDTHKFNPKTLASQFNLPIYPTKGHVVNDEVIESTDEVEHENTALYALKGDAKKAVEFYTKELGAPTESTSDTGTQIWTFKKEEPSASKYRHTVSVTYDKSSKLVQINLRQRVYESAAEANADN